MLLQNKGIVQPSNSVVGDILFYDNEEQDLIIVKGEEWNVDVYEVDRFTPVGIVVVPGYHNVYGDGSCGIMSLKNMDGSRFGSTYYLQNYRYCGILDYSITGLKSSVPTIDSNDADSIVIDYGSSYRCFFPNDFYKSYQNIVPCEHDTNTVYFTGSTTNPGFIPSAYLTNGSRNMSYCQTTTPCDENNALADFNGLLNSKLFYEAISSANTAVYRCRCFYPYGTSEGDWYLPSIAELGYWANRIQIFKNTTNRLINVYGEDISATVHMSASYWSSTEKRLFSRELTMYVVQTNSFMCEEGICGRDSFLIRSFLRINSNGIVRI